MIQKVTGGQPLAAITRGIVEALDPDAHVEAARSANGGAEPSDEQIAEAAKNLLAEAAKPIAANPELRKLLVTVKKAYEQIPPSLSRS
jgi:type I restriction enzyme R subunit